MAAYYSTYPAVQMNSIQMCCISFNMTDRIRLIGVPPSLAPVIREAIMTGWDKKIQDEQEYYGTHEFKVFGNPWRGDGKGIHEKEAVGSRRLVAHILTAMARNGWNLVQSSDVSKKPGDRDTLFFEYGVEDPEVQILAISFNMTDRIRVIDAPSFMPYVKEAVRTQWRKGIQQEQEYYGSLELKLKGNPWWPDGSETVNARLLLTQILANFRALGYKLYGSIDISIGVQGKYASGSELESWFLRKTGPAWQ